MREIAFNVTRAVAVLAQASRVSVVHIVSGALIAMVGRAGSAERGLWLCRDVFRLAPTRRPGRQIGHHEHVDNAGREIPASSSAAEPTELAGLADEGDGDNTGAALRTTHNLFATALPAMRALGVMADDDLWILGPFLRGRLSPEQRARLAAELLDGP